MFKSKIVLAAALLVIPSFLMVSCGSAPTEEPQSVETESVQPEAEETEETAGDEAVTEDADSLEEANEDNDGETADSLWEMIEASRNEAISSGAKDACPAMFDAAENEYNRLKDSDDKESAEYKAALAELNRLYMALKALADAKSKKSRIDEMDFSSYDQKNYDAGSDLIEELSADDSVNLPRASWVEKAFDADAKMSAVLIAGWRAKAKDARSEAILAQKDSNSVKCYISRKDEYKSCQDTLKSGDQKYVTGDPEGAFNDYSSAKEGFAKMFTEVSEARARAQKAVDEAKKRVEESQNTAVQADIEKPLGDEPVEGIEEEDAVLLEEDDFSEAQEADAQMAETSEELEEAEDELESAADEFEKKEAEKAAAAAEEAVQEAQ